MVKSGSFSGRKGETSNHLSTGLHEHTLCKGRRRSLKNSNCCHRYLSRWYRRRRLRSSLLSRLTLSHHRQRWRALVDQALMVCSGLNAVDCRRHWASTHHHSLQPQSKKGKVLPYSLPSVGPGADPGVQAVSPQVTISHPPGGRPPLLSVRPAFYLRKRSPDGDTSNWGNRHLLTAYY